jgi:hypothetical protein
MLKVKTKKVIDVSDWDRLVEETYGKPYSFQQQDGCKDRQHVAITVPESCPEDYENDNIPEVINGNEMGVSFKAWLERNSNSPLSCTEKEARDCNYYWGKTDEDLKTWQEDKGHINMFYERNFYPSVDMIINDLHDKGLLEAGEYEIDIDW